MMSSHRLGGTGTQLLVADANTNFPPFTSLQSAASACTDCRTMPFPLTYRHCQEQSYSLDNWSIPVYLCNHIDFSQKFITDSVPAAED
jgi:hypothetical protein